MSKSSFALCKRTAFRISADDPSYVLNLRAHPADPTKLAASSSDHSIKLYDAATMRTLRILKGHRGLVTGLCFSRGDPNMLWTSSMDRHIMCWDARSGRAVSTMRVPNRYSPLTMDVSCDDGLLAVGTELKQDDAWIFLWDPRVVGSGGGGAGDASGRGGGGGVHTAPPLAEFGEAHSDDIVEVRFANVTPGQLATCSTDGLVNIIDTSLLPTAEDAEDAIIITHNTECSAARVGFFGPRDEYVFALTHMDALSLWHAQPFPEEAEASELITRFPDLKAEMSSAGLETDYFIDCEYRADEERLYLLGGSNSGSAHISHVNVDGVVPTLPLYGGHAATLRSLHWSINSNFIVTGGEDSVLCLWAPEGSEYAMAATTTATVGGASAASASSPSASSEAAAAAGSRSSGGSTGKIKAGVSSNITSPSAASAPYARRPK
eukprot:UC1_evm2s1800